MLYRVDFSQSQWRWLYKPLYDKVLKFALSQGNSELEVQQRFARLVLGDSLLYLFVEVAPTDPSRIISHCMVSLVGNSTSLSTAFVEHLESGSKDFAQECLNFIDHRLKSMYPTLTKIAFSTSRKDFRAFEKKYSFSVDKVFMSRDIKELSMEIGSVEDVRGE